MNSQAVPPSACPECGGARVLVGYGSGDMYLGRQTWRPPRPYQFWVVCCTRCGHMTQYADQQFIAEASEETRQEQMKEQEWLAKEAERQQKRQQK